MLFRCPCCKGSDVRSSKFQLVDVFFCLALLLPVRCRQCRKRFHLFFTLAAPLHAHAHKHKEDHGTT